LNELNRISNVFDDIMAAVRGEVKATITTAEVSMAKARHQATSVIMDMEVLLCQSLCSPSKVTVSSAFAAHRAAAA